jgi:hypothetical protein
VRSEKALVKGLGCRYARLYVTDHCRPRDSQVDTFVALVQKYYRRKLWFHLHWSPLFSCLFVFFFKNFSSHGGKGRTTLFLCMYDMLVNASRGVSFDEFLVVRSTLLCPACDSV